MRGVFPSLWRVLRRCRRCDVGSTLVSRPDRTFMPRDRRQKRDVHALDSEGMVVCNPRDREAAHRAEVEGIAMGERAAVTCRKCLSVLYERERERGGGR